MGAQRRDVMQLILRQAVRPVAIVAAVAEDTTTTAAASDRTPHKRPAQRGVRDKSKPLTGLLAW
ncbi:MAG: hypothetical protein NTW28_02745 [Candidatus Solibacter sp.]|nr:hypothetical protein [Candidatus Solibacter sp.]